MTTEQYSYNPNPNHTLDPDLKAVLMDDAEWRGCLVGLEHVEAGIHTVQKEAKQNPGNNQVRALVSLAFSAAIREDYLRSIYSTRPEQ